MLHGQVFIHSGIIWWWYLSLLSFCLFSKQFVGLCGPPLVKFADFPASSFKEHLFKQASFSWKILSPLQWKLMRWCSTTGSITQYQDPKLTLLSADAQDFGALIKIPVLFFQWILWSFWITADYQIQHRKERNYKNLDKWTDYKTHFCFF